MLLTTALLRGGDSDGIYSPGSSHYRRFLPAPRAAVLGSEGFKWKSCLILLQAEQVLVIEYNIQSRKAKFGELFSRDIFFLKCDLSVGARRGFAEASGTYQALHAIGNAAINIGQSKGEVC